MFLRFYDSILNVFYFNPQTKTALLLLISLLLITL